MAIRQGTDTKIMVNTMGVSGSKVDQARAPFRVINHEIPLIDEKKIYPWRPSQIGALEDYLFWEYSAHVAYSEAG
jgi:hypothetical protein